MTIEPCVERARVRRLGAGAVDDPVGGSGGGHGPRSRIAGAILKARIAQDLSGDVSAGRGSHREGNYGCVSDATAGSRNGYVGCAGCGR